MGRVDAIPHPFVIESPTTEQTEFNPGDRLEFGLILIGRGIEHLPYFILAFEHLHRLGPSNRRQNIAVCAVRQAGRVIYDATARAILRPPETLDLPSTDSQQSASQVRLRFLTPVRIIRQGRLVRRPNFDVLITALLRRLWLLAVFHDQPLELDHRRLIEQAATVRLTQAHTAGTEVRRYSQRQQQVIETNGVIGELCYQGELGPFLPYLRAGELLHVGKGTSFGMGRYQLEVE